MTELVRIDNLSKAYSEGNRQRHILDSANAVIDEGEFVAIRGRSGSGKSTLLNLLAGIDSPTGGDVWIAGAAITQLGARQRTLFRRDTIGFVFQFFNLIPTLSVLENVLLPAELAGAAGADIASDALALLDQVGLADRRDVFPDRLSGGEQQRVAIARALVRNPRLILADEPTGNLDDATGESVMQLLDQTMRQRGKSVIMVTHSRKLAARADRVLTIEQGKIVPLASE